MKILADIELEKRVSDLEGMVATIIKFNISQGERLLELEKYAEGIEGRRADGSFTINIPRVNNADGKK